MALVEVSPSSGAIVQINGSEPFADTSVIVFDEAGRAGKIWISQRLAAEAPRHTVRIIETRMVRVRLRQEPSKFVPPQIDGMKSDWVQAEFVIGVFGPDRRKGHSSQPSDRADLQARPSIVTKSL